jgi:5-methyltetrahydrofolate--homocysteine methyltransferase
LRGGATTSRLHTAVKIQPQYPNGVVHVLDASRSVTVAGSLLTEHQKNTFLSSINTEYEKLRDDFNNKKVAKQFLSIQQARQQKFEIDWNNFQSKTPTFTGSKQITEVPLSEIRKYIDWQPFFIAWELHGKFPAILSDAVVGAEATKLYNDANALLDVIVKEEWLTPQGAIGFWSANSNGADTVNLQLEGEKIMSLEFLRQQIKKAAGEYNLALSDFIAPEETGKADYLGAFSVTIKGIEPHIKKFEAAHDDYNKIMLQALADRLAEAFAEWLHQKIRLHEWGYEKEELLTNEQLIREQYNGIRPAPGYPACPDHTEKYKLFELLGGEAGTGIQLTESLAMYPASSVCGWYFAHPKSKYFGVGKIEQDQLKEYANRKNMSLEEATKWLRPILD